VGEGQRHRRRPGRGSAAGSIVSYALRITDVDPLRYDLLFERLPESRLGSSPTRLNQVRRIGKRNPELQARHPVLDEALNRCASPSAGRRPTSTSTSRSADAAAVAQIITFGNMFRAGPAEDGLPGPAQPGTYEMMARGDSVGVFQFESEGMQNAAASTGASRTKNIRGIVRNASIPTHMTTRPIHENQSRGIAVGKKNPWQAQPRQAHRLDLTA